MQHDTSDKATQEGNHKKDQKTKGGAKPEKNKGVKPINERHRPKGENETGHQERSQEKGATLERGGGATHVQNVT